MIGGNIGLAFAIVSRELQGYDLPIPTIKDHDDLVRVSRFKNIGSGDNRDNIGTGLERGHKGRTDQGRITVFGHGIQSFRVRACGRVKFWPIIAYSKRGAGG